MKVTPKLVSVLTQASKINPACLLREGNEFTVKSPEVLFSSEIDVKIPSESALANTAMFLDFFNLFSGDIELEFSKNSIKMTDGVHSSRFQIVPKEFISEAIPNKSLKELQNNALGDCIVDVKIEKSKLAHIKTAIKTLREEHIGIVSNGRKVELVVKDYATESGNNFKIDLYSVPDSEEDLPSFNYVFKGDTSIALLSDDEYTLRVYKGVPSIILEGGIGSFLIGTITKYTEKAS